MLFLLMSPTDSVLQIAPGAVWRKTSMVGYADYRVGSCNIYYFVYGKK